MSVNIIKKIISYLKEVQDIALFVSMTDVRLSTALRASPVFYILLPFIGFLLTVTAFLNGFSLLKARNKNVDLWLDFVSSALSALLASISLYGAALSAVMDFTFSVGSWFFFSGLVVAITHQIVMMGINFSRALAATKESVQRMHHTQAAIKNGFSVTGLLAALGSVVFVMLFPTVSPLIGTLSALSISIITFAGIQWRIIPHNWKLAVKEFLHFGKPEIKQNISPTREHTPLLAEKNAAAPFQSLPPQNYNRLFAYCYADQVRKMDLQTAQCFLIALINAKSKAYAIRPLSDQKSKDKIAVLDILSQAMDLSVALSEELILEKHPLAFQSFWTEKGEIQQIFEAVMEYRNKKDACEYTEAACTF